jgi:hypothetical protein
LARSRGDRDDGALMRGTPDGRLERRQNRSSDALVALSRLLDATRRQGGLEALAVADATGCLVAGSGPFRVCEELAAWAPLIAAQPANDVVPTRLDVLARRTEARRLALDGIEVLICGQGEDEARDRALDRIAEGCERILSSRR